MNGTRCSHVNKRRKEAWKSIKARLIEKFPTVELPNDLPQWYKRFISDTKKKFQLSKKTGQGGIEFTEAEELVLDGLGRDSPSVQGLMTGELGMHGFSSSLTEDSAASDDFMDKINLDSADKNSTFPEYESSVREIPGTITINSEESSESSKDDNEWSSSSQVSRAGRKKEEAIEKLTRETQLMKFNHDKLITLMMKKRKADEEINFEIKKTKLEAQKMTVELIKFQMELTKAQMELVQHQLKKS
ncbi:hypothetical protein FO519_005044 [Halicephalobus sp. NKZ332]|nr:hypothetical protein FO519_005044 [Halicephalobus sp. NKZ332]